MRNRDQLKDLMHTNLRATQESTLRLERAEVPLVLSDFLHDHNQQAKDSFIERLIFTVTLTDDIVFD